MKWTVEPAASMRRTQSAQKPQSASHRSTGSTAPSLRALLSPRRVGRPVPAQPLDGRALSKRIEAELTAEVADLSDRFGKAPGLAVILVGEDPASAIYVGRKQKACARVGIDSTEHRLPDTTSEDELVGLIEKLNRDADVNGILVQLPLPAHIDPARVIGAITPYKDVDAFHPQNVGQALLGHDRMAPCTPQGIVLLLEEAGIELQGAAVAIINHSNIVGKPLAAMLMNRNASVTVLHEYSRDVEGYLRHMDIVVTGTSGHRRLTAAELKEGAVVVDVSMVRDADGTLHGDATDDVWDVASWVTPVPGGVGPMTIAVLLQNTVRSFKAKMGLVEPA